VCGFFTDRGWTSALASDWRLRDVAQEELVIEQHHLLRLAYEGTYDLRKRPPVVPIDVIFDVPAGAIVKDARSGDIVRVSTSPERLGFHIDFLFDGHRWRADRVGPVTPDNQAWAALPTPLPPAPRCVGFVRDQGARPFDERAGRTWCDGDGRGGVLRAGLEFTMHTRYPCDVGHATILAIGRPLGAQIDPLVRWEYVRDPADDFLRWGWLRARYDGDATLPSEAVYSGWTNGNIELWINPSEWDAAVYLVRGRVVERWPRAVDQWGVTDCN
jgi:hypothetical protein